MSNDSHKIELSVVKKGERGRAEAQSWLWSDLIKRLSKPIVDKKHTQAQYAALDVDRKSVAKDVGGYVAGAFRDGMRRAEELQFRSAITLDIDEVDADLIEEILERGTPISKWEWFATTTRSHTPKNPKWRIVIPLTRNVYPEEYAPLARIVGSKLSDDIDEAMDAIDPVSFRASQMMYWPAISKDGSTIAARLG